MSSSRSPISSSHSAGDKRKREEARHLARKLMASDTAMLAVLISDRKGKAFAYEGQPRARASEIPGAKEIERIAMVEFMALKLSERPGQDTGNTEYVVYVYEKFKILVSELRGGDFILGARLTRSSNSEYILNKLLRDFR
jgi:hypothetical protein